MKFLHVHNPQVSSRRVGLGASAMACVFLFLLLWIMAVPGQTVQFCWLFAREGLQSKLGPAERRTISYDARFSSKLKKQILRANILPPGSDLVASDPGHKWHASFAPWGGQVVGAAIFRTTAKFDVMACLSPEQRCVREHWSTTRYADQPLVLVDVLEVVGLQEPFTVRSAHAHVTPTALFFECTPFSVEAMLAVVAVDGASEVGVSTLTLREKILQWFNQYRQADNIQQQDADAQLRFLKSHGVCFNMPAAHALLLAKQAWKSYAFPLTGRRQAAGLGLRLVSNLWKSLPEPGPCQGAGAGWGGSALEQEGGTALLQPETLQAMADFMRKAAAALPGLAEEAERHVVLLQQSIDNMVQDAQLNSRRAFDLEVLVNSLVVSGYLQNSADMRDLLQAVLRVCIRVPEMLHHFEELLRQPRRVPGSATLYRHRLTVHIAFCRWVSNINNSTILSNSGFCRWGTLDASPQGSWDWLLAGATLARMSDIETCLHDANRLISLGNKHDAQETCLEQASIASRLAEHLTIVQGTPTAVGAGRSGLVRKVHALAHSVRLSAANWKQTCKLLNETVTWTADLGVESGLNMFRGNVCAMFGDWVKGEIDPRLLDDGAPFERVGQEGPQQPVQDFGFLTVGQDAEHVSPDISEYLKDYNLDFTSSIYIPGPLHIMRNLTESLGDAMSWWSEFVLRLIHLCRLLNRKWNRQRLFATCFSHPPWNEFMSLYAAFDGQVYQGRWGSVLRAVKQLLPLEASLRGAWCKASFLLNGHQPREGRDGTGGKGLSVDIVDDACHSQLFWAYVRMVSELGNIIEHIMFWCESCPCHGHDEALQGKAKHTKKGLFARIGLHSCPMASRRAPECAAGQILEFIRQGLQSLRGVVTLQNSFLACSESDRQVVLSDCSHAKRHCMFVATVKFANWEQLPWVMMGVAHHDVDVARQCASRALRLYAAAGDEAQRHPMSHVMCARGTVGHEQMVAFIEGQSLASLPLLSRIAAKWKFVPICERWIESRHALVKRQLKKATHVSAQHVAFAGCQPMLRELLLRKPSEFNELVTLCSFTKTPAKALEAVGLHHHPGVRDLFKFDRSKLSRKYRPWVVELLYHVDRETLFQALPQDGGYVPDNPGNGGDGPGNSGRPKGCSLQLLPRALEDVGNMNAAEGGAGGAGDGGNSGDGASAFASHSVQAVPASDGAGTASGSAPPSSEGGILHDSLWCKYAVDHLRHVLEEKEQPKCQYVLSLGPRLQTNLQSCLKSLADHVNPVPEQSAALVPVLEQFDFLQPQTCQGALQHEDQWGGRRGALVFTITASHPSNVKVPQYARQIRDRDSLAISTVQLRYIDLENKRLFLRVEDEQSPILFQAAALSVDDFATLRLWQGDGVLQYDFGLPDGCEFSENVQACVRQLVKADRFHPNKIFRLPAHQDKDGKKTEALQKLLEHGVVSKDGREHWTEWALTEIGRKRLQTSEVYRNPQCILQSAPPTVSLEDRTRFQLMCDMRTEGWRLCIHGAGQQRKKAQSEQGPRLPYRLGDAKVWWLRENSVAIDAEYLRALLSASEHQQPVPHFLASAAYTAIRTGIEQSKKRKQLEFDFLAVEDCEGNLEKLVRKPIRVAAQQVVAKRMRKKGPAPDVAKPADLDVVSTAATLPADEPGMSSQDCVESMQPCSSLLAVQDDQIAQGSESEAEPSQPQPSSEQGAVSDSASETSSSVGDDSDSNSSTTTSSTSSSSSSSDDPDPASSRRPQLQSGAANQQSAAMPAEESRSGPRRHEGNFKWKGFKFTRVYDKDGRAKGMEATCYLQDHQETTGCRRTRLYGRVRSPEMCERMLKFWCLQACRCTTRSAHVKDTKDPKPDDLPSLSDLDSRQGFLEDGVWHAP